MLTEKTENAFLCIELVDEKRESEFQNALKELAEITQQNIGGSYKVFVMDKDHFEIEIDE